ncbi:MAG TPA: hypothetical protein VKB53_13140 [Gammaproteobacteria bacterium]|nr:hypothetical protein [Gammaproteobacteria bacterium]
MMAAAAALPGNEFKARLGSFSTKRNPEIIPLVNIVAPAVGGGMKGLTFNVAQLPGLIRALQQVRVEAIERGLLGRDPQ